LNGINGTLTSSGRAAPVDIGQTLARLDTVRCGGCHQQAVGQVIGRVKGGGAFSVPAVPFVHVAESGTLSNMLSPDLLMRRFNQQALYLRSHHPCQVKTGTSSGTLSSDVQGTPTETLLPRPQPDVDELIGLVAGATEAFQTFQIQYPTRHPDEIAAQKRMALRQVYESSGVGLN
jgi:hypothetical protein